jgi:hypothetical protein
LKVFWMAKRDEQRTEATVAVLTVVAIFSFAGILSWGDAAIEKSERAAPSIVESQVVGGAGDVLPAEGVTVVETASVDLASSAEGAPASGTSLSPAVSQFLVDGGTELSSGTAQITVGSK